MLPQISQPELTYERLRLLLEINNAVVSTLDRHELIHTISQALRDVVPHDFSALATYSEETQQLRAPLGELKLTTTATIAVSPATPGPRSLEDVERQHIQEILEQTRGVIGGKGGAAEILGLPTSTLRNRMKKLGLK